jgi:hypothetical protein
VIVADYLEDTVRVWLGLRPGTAAAPTMPDDLARLFLRSEELETDERDRWGCFDFAAADNARRGALGVAEVDRWLGTCANELARTVPLEPRWPDGRRFAICLTHDVDVVSTRSTPAQVVRDARAAFGPDGGSAFAVRAFRPPVRLVRGLRRLSRAPSLRETLERSVALEAERGLTASYFFTVPPAGTWTRWDCVYAPGDACEFRGETRSIADVMRTLRDEGFDVGLHGSYESARAPGVLRRERARLEDDLAGAVTTTRQHFLHWDVRWTPQLQEAAGLRADSSLGYNRTVGFRAGTSLPFRQFDLTAGRTLDVVQVPLVVQDAALLGPIAAGGSREEPREAVRRLFDEVAEVGGAITLVFHPDKLVRPAWRALYEWTLDHAVASGGWVTSVAGLDAWWRERERLILER